MAVLAALVVGGVAACSVATPTPHATAEPTPQLPSGASHVPSVPASPTATATARPSAATVTDEWAVDLGTEIRVQALSREFTETVLEYASTGTSLLFSAGPEADAAPDLWRLRPGPSAEPELVWRNEARDRSLVVLGGDLDTIAFVDMPITGARGWKLWLIPTDGAEAILLDSGSDSPDVSSFVPSFFVFQPSIAWTAFDMGPAGPVSQLLYAQAPDWEPTLIAERDAAVAELWFPSLSGNSLVYQEIVYADDHLSDERRVFALSLGEPESAARRLDTSGRASMPLINQFGIAWKEADPGFNMLNWGTMWRYDPDTGGVSRLDTGGQEYVNYPAVGERFVAWWLADPTRFGVFDLERGVAREIARYPSSAERQVIEPHLSGKLLVWLYAEDADGESWSEIRYALLPGAGSDRGVP